MSHLGHTSVSLLRKWYASGGQAELRIEADRRTRLGNGNDFAVIGDVVDAGRPACDRQERGMCGIFSIWTSIFRSPA